MLSQDAVKDMIKEHEGYVGEVYEDSVGVLTCGWGHALHLNSPVPIEAAEAFFKRDFKTATMAAERLIYNHKLKLNDVRHAVLVDMMYNLGYAGVCKFKKFIRAMEHEVWQAASYEMMNSKWATQVGRRAVRLAQMMRTGEWEI